MVNTLTALLCAGITLNTVAAVPIVAPGTFGASHAPARLDGVRPVYRRDASIPERRAPKGKPKTTKLTPTKKSPTKPAPKASPPKKQKPPSTSGGPGIDLWGAGATLTGASDILNAGMNAWSTTQSTAEAPVDPATAPVRRALFGKKGGKTKTGPRTTPKTKPGTTKKQTKSGGSGIDLYGAGMSMTGGADLLNAGMNVWSSTQPAPPVDPATAPVRRALTKKPAVKMPSGKKVTPTKPVAGAKPKPGAKTPGKTPAATKPKTSWRSKLPKVRMPSIDGYGAGMAMTGVGDLVNSGVNAWASTRPAETPPAEAAPAEVPAEEVPADASVPARREVLSEREWDEYIYDELD